jgi:hypothetical protein
MIYHPLFAIFSTFLVKNVLFCGDDALLVKRRCVDEVVGTHKTKTLK